MTYPMNQDVKREWCAWLRLASPDAQHVGGLGRYEEVKPSHFWFYRSVFGHLCEVAARAGVVECRYRELGIIAYYDPLDDVTYELEIPPSVQMWAGINGVLGPNVPNPWYDPDDDGGPDGYPELDQVDLQYLNDKGMSLADLADVIEESL